MTSILIPAHNEAAVIGRTLQSLLASLGDRQAEIVVVCNACTDNTAEIARGTSARVTVLETPRPGKCAAINLGEQQLTTYPRIYLDADIQVSASFVADIERPLQTEAAKVAWPGVIYDLSHSSWPVAAFYRVWTALPYNKPGRIGVGAYALSAQGRAKFDTFPEIISDDGFIRGLFGPGDRALVDSCQTIVQAAARSEQSDRGPNAFADGCLPAPSQTSRRDARTQHAPRTSHP